jgi:predicted RNA-binding Zn-ribbon protein involved in translation (DUF1610 family)
MRKSPFLFRTERDFMPPKVERCVRSLMKDPNFKPKKKGQKKRDAAYALCTWLNQQGYLKDSAADKVSAEQQNTFTCECLSCKHIVESKKHCIDITCPKCGGQMRRKDRPGVGRSIIIESEIKDDEVIIWKILI